MVRRRKVALAGDEVKSDREGMTVQAEDSIDGMPKKTSKKVPTDSCNSNGEAFAAALQPEPMLPASPPNRAGPLPVDAQRLLRSSVRPPIKRARSDSSSTPGKGRAEAVAGSVDAAGVTSGCGTNTNAGAARREQGSVGTPSDSTEVEKTEGPQKKVRRQWESWSTEDKNSFFEGLNEHGKDFEAIQNSFAQRYRKKGRPANMVKNKEQVRHFYYRTWHKICKYIDFDSVFSQDLKKSSQELYGLICYGELRKKIGGCMDDKKASKLNELIQIGVTTVRYKGRNLRIKMPTCRSLKKICDPYGASDDEDQKPAKLPPKVCLELLPKTNKAWAHVQNTAHNPRLRMIVELHRKVASLIAFLQEKWSPRSARLRSNLSEGLQRTSEDVRPSARDVQHSELRLYPPKEAVVTLLAGVARVVHTKALCTVHWHQEGRARHASLREGLHVAKMTSCKDSGGVGSPVSVGKVPRPPRPHLVAEGQVDSVNPDGDGTVLSPPEEICSGGKRGDLRRLAIDFAQVVCAPNLCQSDNLDCTESYSDPLRTSTNFCPTPPWPSGIPSTSVDSPLPVPPRWNADDNCVSDAAMHNLQSGRNVSNPADSDDCEGLTSEGTVTSPGEQCPKIKDYSNCGPTTSLEAQGEAWINEDDTQNARVIAGLAECGDKQEMVAKKVSGESGVEVSEDAGETGRGTGFPPKKSKEEAAIEFANHLREEGWGAATGPLTIAEVYLMLGKPSKLQLDYDWPELGGPSMTRVNGQCTETLSSTPLLPLNTTCTAEAWDPTLRTGLKQLLQLAILQVNAASTQDPSGLTLPSKLGAEGSVHGTQRSPGSARGAGGRAARNLTVASSGPKPHARIGGLAASATTAPAATPEAAGLTGPVAGEATRQSLDSDGGQRDNAVVFRIPAPPLPAALQLTGSSCEDHDAEMAFRQQLDSINKQPEMYLPQQRKMRNRPLRKPLVVQRTLLPRPTGQPTRHMYELSIIPNSSAAGTGMFSPILPHDSHVPESLKKGEEADNLTCFINLAAKSAGILPSSPQCVPPLADSLDKDDTVKGSVKVTDGGTPSILQPIIRRSRRVPLVTLALRDTSELGATANELGEEGESDEMPSESCCIAPSPPHVSTLLDISLPATPEEGISQSGTPCHVSDAIIEIAINSSGVGQTLLSPRKMNGEDVDRSLTELPSTPWLSSPPHDPQWYSGDISLGGLISSVVSPDKGRRVGATSMTGAPAVVPPVSAHDGNSHDPFLSTRYLADVTEVDTQLACMMSESSVDYVSRFTDLARAVSAAHSTPVRDLAPAEPLPHSGEFHPQPRSSL